MQSELFLVFISAFFSVAILSPIMRKIALFYNVVDYPNSPHKSHQRAIPYLGGIAIIVGIFLTVYSSILISNESHEVFWLANSIFLPALFLGFVGLIDDMKNLDTWPRFLAQSTTAFITALLLIETNNIGTPTGSHFFDFFITIFWIVGICNSINFFDNFDGGATVASATISFGLIIISSLTQQIFIAGLSTVILGAMLGFFIWNKNPARIFMGDAGSLFLGFLLATLSIRLKPLAESEIASFFTPFFLLALPILDTTVAVTSRLMRNLSPFHGGQDHLSHILLRLNFSKLKVIIAIFILSIFFVSLSIIINIYTESWKLIMGFGMGIWISLFFYFLNKSKFSAQSRN